MDSLTLSHPSIIISFLFSHLSFLSSFLLYSHCLSVCLSVCHCLLNNWLLLTSAAYWLIFFCTSSSFLSPFSALSIYLYLSNSPSHNSPVIFRFFCIFCEILSLIFIVDLHVDSLCGLLLISLLPRPSPVHPLVKRGRAESPSGFISKDHFLFFLFLFLFFFFFLPPLLFLFLSYFPSIPPPHKHTEPVCLLQPQHPCH